MDFEFYVLNYDTNQKKVINYNIFNNIRVNEYTEKEIKKYLRAPGKYKREGFRKDEKTLYGFEALCKEIDSLIQWQEWSRREYEISVGDAFENDCNKLEKWDCYQQAHPNIEAITREVIYQYKQQLKAMENKDGINRTDKLS